MSASARRSETTFQCHKYILYLYLYLYFQGNTFYVLSLAQQRASTYATTQCGARSRIHAAMRRLEHGAPNTLGACGVRNVVILDSHFVAFCASLAALRGGTPPHAARHVLLSHWLPLRGAVELGSSVFVVSLRRTRWSVQFVPHMPSTSADPHVHSQNEMYRHIISAPHHYVDTNAESRLHLPS